MTTTNTQLYTLVGEELAIIDGNEPLGADDTDRISRRASRVRAWLIEDGKAYWADNAIPDAAALPLAMIIAGEVRDQYGRGDASPFPYTKGPRGYQLLCEHVSIRSPREAVRADYF
jgi:hypothetical protein